MEAFGVSTTTGHGGRTLATPTAASFFRNSCKTANNSQSAKIKSYRMIEGIAKNKKTKNT
jgi:hypothetical protein